MVERLEPAPEPNLKSMPSVLARVRIDSIVSSTLLMKQARALRVGVDADVEPDGAVEAGALLEQDVLQLVAERLGVLIGREVGVLDAPVRDRVGDAVDHLLDRALPFGRAEVAAEVLAGHDVGGQGAPGLRELEVLLLEHGLAVLVGDGRLAQVPLDGVVRVDVRAGVAPLDGQALPGRLLALRQLDVAASSLRLPVPVPVDRCRSVGLVAVAVSRCRWRTWWGRWIGPWCGASLFVLRPSESARIPSVPLGPPSNGPAPCCAPCFQDDNCNTPAIPRQGQNHNIWWYLRPSHH